MEATVSHRAVVSIPTEVGIRTFTDVTFEWAGEHYGSRYHGALGPHEIEVERKLFERRRHKLTAVT